MSLASDLDDLFGDDKNTIITEPLRFKAKLGIGERAYRLLRAREHLTTITEAIGVGGAASVVAGSSVVAGTFFAPSGFLASLGLGATAATPIGWVLAAGVASGAAYFGISRFFERSKDSQLVVIPRYINTPLDIIAVALMELMLPISLKVAKSDGVICERERAVLHDYYVNQWGYHALFVDRMIADYEENPGKVSFAVLAKSLQEYCHNNPDCDPKIILDGFLTHITEVVEANGNLDERELQQLSYLTQLMTRATENSQIHKAMQSAGSGVSKSVGKAAGTAAQGLASTADLAGKLARKAQLVPGKLQRIFKRKSPPEEDQ